MLADPSEEGIQFRDALDDFIINRTENAQLLYEGGEREMGCRRRDPFVAAPSRTTGRTPDSSWVSRFHERHINARK